MIEKFLRFLRGYVQICVSGGQLERFLNLCKSRRISLEKICSREGDRITAFLTLKDFFLLRPVRSKSKVHICVLKKRGLPFFFYRNKKRKAFFLGILAAFLLMLLLSGRIWNIHVEGNKRNSTPEILTFLEKEGITHGMAKNKIDCGEIASLVRRNYQDIAWVSVRIQGTRLLLTVQEGILTEETEEGEAPCNLSADRSGTIVKMITRQGIPLVHPGDTCKEGDLLVSGELSIMNDSQEVVRYAYVKADADIWVQYTRSYHKKFPLKHQTEIPTGQKKYGVSLSLGRTYLEAYPALGKGWRREEEVIPLRITENFFLPIVLEKAVYREYTPKTSVYTKEEAEALAFRQLHLYEEKILAKGAEIIGNNVSVKVTDTDCISEGSLTIIEKSGRETPVTTKEVPRSRE